VPKVLPILKYPHPILRKKARPIEKITKEIFELVEDMTETMLKNDGVGLSGNQVGRLLRVFVANFSPGNDKPTPIAILNPDIISKNGEVIYEEGCLSFPELYLNIPRPEEICLRAKNLYNETLVLDVSGIFARIVLHESEHLDGILFIDNILDKEKEKVARYLKQHQKENIN